MNAKIFQLAGLTLCTSRRLPSEVAFPLLLIYQMTADVMNSEISLSLCLPESPFLLILRTKIAYSEASSSVLLNNQLEENADLDSPPSTWQILL
jgi:hypothetical protein